MSEFKGILGNIKNLKHLSGAYARDRLSHAYIINGPEGSGRRTFVNYISAALMCDRIRTDENEAQQSFFGMPGSQPEAKRTIEDGPCGSCPSCIKAMSGNHPDIIRLTREKEKLISVNDIRQQVIADMAVKPYYGGYKVYIIEDAQLMNENAQNALLKTIEEPPEYGIVFLITDNADSLLETIRSRCIRLDMDRLPEDVIISELTGEFGTDAETAGSYAAFSGGNLGTAIQLARGGEESEFIKSVTDLLKELSGMNAADIYDAAVQLGKENTAYALKIMQMWFRDMLVYKSSGQTGGSYFPLEKTYMDGQCRRMSYEAFDNIFREIDKAGKRLEANVKAEAAVECLLLSIRMNLRK